MTKLFTVGPITMRESVLQEGAKQPPYFRDPSYGEMAKTIIVDLLALLRAPEGSQLATLTASGTAGMEAAVINLFDEHSKVLVIDGGSFGRRFVEICEGYGIPHEVVKIAPGTDLKREHLEPYGDFDGLLVNMHETSTGQLYDIAMLGQLCAERDALLVCDVISSFLADPYDMGAMGANVSVLSTNKGLGLAPGLALVALDSKAASRLKRPKSLYFRLEDYLVNAKRGQTPYTPAISVMLQLRKRLDEIKAAGGYDAVVAQVRAQAMDFREKSKRLGLGTFPETPSNYMTTLVLEEGQGEALYQRMRDEFGIYINPATWGFEKPVCKICHAGDISADDNTVLVDALAACLS